MKRGPTKRSRLRFFIDIIAELRKVIWPTRQETLRLTIIVLIICIAIGLILGGIDYGFTQLVREIFIGKGG